MGKASTNDKKVKCCRCRNIHFESERIMKPDPKLTAFMVSCCPCCGAWSFLNTDV